MYHQQLQQDGNQLLARCAGAGATRPEVAEPRFVRLMAQGTAMIRRLSILSLAICLAGISGCTLFCNSPACSGEQPDGCNVCCFGKRLSELRSPTDIRKTHFWCFGEDAIFHYPCGPKPEFYGAEPTCWREWPTSGAEWRDGSCGAQCGRDLSAPVESGVAPANIQPPAASQPTLMGPAPPVPLEKTDQPREPMPVPAGEPTSFMERPQREEDVLTHRMRGQTATPQQAFVVQAGLPRPIFTGEQPAPTAQSSAAVDAIQASFVPGGVPSPRVRTTGPSGSLNPFFDADVTPISATKPPEPSADRAFVPEMALEHSTSFGEGAVTTTQKIVSNDSPQTARAVRGKALLPSSAAGPSGSIAPLGKKDAVPTAASSCVEPDADQSQDQEAALRRCISY